MADANYVELKAIFSVARRWWWLIAGVALLAAGVAVIVTSLLPPVYVSTTTVMVNPAKNSSVNQYNDLMAGAQLASTYSQMLTDRPVLETVIQELALPYAAETLSKQITAEPVRNSQIIRLTVSDSDPNQAALIANTLVQAFTRRIQELSAGRYAGAIKSAKDRMDSLMVQTTDLQAQIDTLRNQKVIKDVALANKQTSLTITRSDYESLQNSYHELQLSVAEKIGNVYIFEPVQVQRDDGRAAYVASSIVSISQSPIGNENNPADDTLALTFGQLMTKPPVLEKVITALGLSETPDQLSQKISYSLVPGTQLIQLKVEDADELRAQLIAQSLVDGFVLEVKSMLTTPFSDQLDQMENQIAEQQELINSTQTDIGVLTSDVAQLAADLDRLETDLLSVRGDYRSALQYHEQIKTTAVEASDSVMVTETAQPAKHTTQNRILFIVVAAFLGFAVGTGSAFLLQYVDDKIRTDQDVRSTINLPIFSRIGQFTNNTHSLIMETAPESRVAEDFRSMGNKIRLLVENGSVRTLLITSPDHADGKSSIVANLAVSLSRMGLRVVVIDADLRCPRIHSIFGLSQNFGLVNSLYQGSVNGALQSTKIEELKIITSGVAPTNAAELLGSSDLGKLLQMLRKMSDLIIIDCPPVLVASDASILASKVDGVLLVLRSGSSEGLSARNAIEALEQVKAKMYGIVLNAVPEQRKGYSYYYHKD